MVPITKEKRTILRLDFFLHFDATYGGIEADLTVPVFNQPRTDLHSLHTTQQL